MKKRITIMILVSLIICPMAACENVEKSKNPQVSTLGNTSTKSDVGTADVVTSGFTSTDEKVSNAWVKKKEMPVKLFTQRAAVLNGRIYVLGNIVKSNENKDSDYNDMYEYNPETETWTKKSPSIAGKGRIETSGGLAVVNGKLYVLGGVIRKSDGSFERKTYNVQEYDPLTDKWVLKGTLPNENSSFGVAAINDKIYVVGGELSKVDEYNPTTNKWMSIKSRIPQYYQDAGTIALNGKMYIFGGSGTSAVSEYDPDKDTWTLGSSIPTQRIHLYPVASGNLIFAINSVKFPEMQVCNNVEVFDPAKNEWKIRNASPYASFSSAIAEVNGRIYMIGGMRTGTWKDPVYEVYEYNPALDR